MVELVTINSKKKYVDAHISLNHSKNYFTDLLAFYWRLLNLSKQVGNEIIFNCIDEK